MNYATQSALPSDDDSSSSSEHQTPKRSTADETAEIASRERCLPLFLVG